MFDKLPAFNPPDNHSAGAVALRAWVRGLTARGPPALAFLRKYEEESFARDYNSFLPSGGGSTAKKDQLACAPTELSHPESARTSSAASARSSC